MSDNRLPFPTAKLIGDGVFVLELQGLHTIATIIKTPFLLELEAVESGVVCGLGINNTKSTKPPWQPAVFITPCNTKALAKQTMYEAFVLLLEFHHCRFGLKGL